MQLLYLFVIEISGPPLTRYGIVSRYKFTIKFKTFAQSETMSKTLLCPSYLFNFLLLECNHRPDLL